jgi:hypothetical protein
LKSAGDGLGSRGDGYEDDEDCEDNELRTPKNHLSPPGKLVGQLEFVDETYAGRSMESRRGAAMMPLREIDRIRNRKPSCSAPVSPEA